MRSPRSGTRLKDSTPLFPDDAELDELVFERIRVYHQRCAQHLRELEAYKLKRGICVGGFSCMRKAIPSSGGANNGKGRLCASHAAAYKSGLRFRQMDGYMSEYGKLRQQQVEEEREAKRIAAEEEKREKKRTPKPKTRAKAA